MLIAMHTPDHVLSPAVAMVTASATAAVAIWSAWRLRSTNAGAKSQPAGLIASVAALIFAGQMVNYTLPFSGAGEGVSGHLLGGAIAALLLGPWAAMGVMVMVLAVQCLVFGDGGLAAFGANALNMAIVGVWTAWGVRRLMGDASKPVSLPVAAVAGFASVVAAATFCSLELLASGNDGAASIIQPMLTYHLAIGAVEGLLTAGVVAAVAVYQSKSKSTSFAGAAQARMKGALAGLVAALVIAAVLSPLASASPDGLEVALARGNFAAGESLWSAPFADYELPASLGTTNFAAGIAIAILGTLAAFAGSWSATRVGLAAVRSAGTR